MQRTLLVFESSKFSELDRRWHTLWYVHIAVFYVVASLWSHSAVDSDMLLVMLGSIIVPLFLMRAFHGHITHGCRRILANSKTVAIKRRGKPAQFIKRRDCISYDYEKNALVLRNHRCVTLWDPMHPDGDAFRQGFLSPLSRYWWPGAGPKLSQVRSILPPIDTQHAVRFQMMGLFIIAPFTLFIIFIANAARPVPVWAPLSGLLLVPLYVLFRWHRQTRRLARVAGKRERAVCQRGSTGPEGSP